jgi:hypothetical protein
MKSHLHTVWLTRFQKSCANFVALRNISYYVMLCVNNYFARYSDSAKLQLSPHTTPKTPKPVVCHDLVADWIPFGGATAERHTKPRPALAMTARVWSGLV